MIIKQLAEYSANDTSISWGKAASLFKWYNCNFMKRIAFFFTFSLLFLACGNRGAGDRAPEAGANFFEGKDAYGREVVIPSEPQRIISLSPAITEITFLLHSEDKLVGITDFCDYPPETSRIQRVGTLLNINVESLLKLQPDLILIGSVVSKKDVAKMEEAQVPVYSVKAEGHVEDIFTTIGKLGVILNKQGAADSLIASYKSDLQQVKNLQDSTTERKSVYYVVGFGDAGDYTAPGKSFINDIIQLAGGRNIAEQLQTWSISREFLFQQDPDYIFIRAEDRDAFCRTYPYTKLNAVKAGRVYPINSGWIDQLSPRNIEAIKLIHSKISE